MLADRNFWSSPFPGFVSANVDAPPVFADRNFCSSPFPGFVSANVDAPPMPADTNRLGALGGSGTRDV
jgi:hypothetical protein